MKFRNQQAEQLFQENENLKRQLRSVSRIEGSPYGNSYSSLGNSPRHLLEELKELKQDNQMLRCDTMRLLTKRNSCRNYY